MEELKKIISSMESVLVAYSGGVDSNFLLKVALDTLGKDKVVAVTAESVTFPDWELDFAKQIAKQWSVKHIIIETEELNNPDFFNNSKDRCYFCKKELFTKLKTVANQENLNFVVDGANFDDLNDYRPGMRAAAELNVRSPLKEARLTKKDIRKFSKDLNLSTWDKPSFACLSSRFPYGEIITEKGLYQVGEAEKFLKELGFRQLRVRHHETMARVEVLSDEVDKFLDRALRTKVVNKLKNIGYKYVTIDLEGYRTGSMNEVLEGGDKNEKNIS